MSKLINVKIVAERTNQVNAVITRVVSVEKQATERKTRNLAELTFCNEYINRDTEIFVHDNLSKAKKNG